MLLFAGHDQGAENWACIASLIETSNDASDRNLLPDVLTTLVQSLAGLATSTNMPWAWAAERARKFRQARYWRRSAECWAPINGSKPWSGGEPLRTTVLIQNRLRTAAMNPLPYPYACLFRLEPRSFCPAPQRTSVTSVVSKEQSGSASAVLAALAGQSGFGADISAFRATPARPETRASLPSTRAPRCGSALVRPTAPC